jgi:hypothetical protein
VRPAISAFVHVRHAAQAAVRAAVCTEAGLAQAAPFYDTIITRVQAENQKYPAIWWNAWMRRLTINDRLKQGTNEIAMRIGQLILIDPGLGGELYKGEFERLRNKHALSGK